jgi:hypothetical protein
VPVDAELIPIESVQTILRSEPQESGWILGNGGHDGLREPILDVQVIEADARRR